MLREKHRRDDLVVFGCILGNRWGGVVMRALLVDGRHISGVVYVGLGIVICGWGLWGCRSVGSSGNAQLQSQPRTFNTWTYLLEGSYEMTLNGSRKIIDVKAGHTYSIPTALVRFEAAERVNDRRFIAITRTPYHLTFTSSEPSTPIDS